MSADKFIHKIAKIEKLDGITQKIVETNRSIVPTDKTTVDKAYFDSLMRKENATTTELAAIDPVKAQSLNKGAVVKHDSFINEVAKLESTSTPSSAKDYNTRVHNIRSKAQDSSKQIRGLRERLIDPQFHKNNQVNSKYNTPLRNKWASIKDHLQVLSKTSGIKSLNREADLELEAQGDSDDTTLSKLPKPVRKFINLLTEGQNKLEQLDRHLLTLHEQELSPAKMLAIQVKMGHIQHEIELFASLLNKAIESTKTIMNTQV